MSQLGTYSHIKSYYSDSVILLLWDAMTKKNMLQLTLQPMYRYHRPTAYIALAYMVMACIALAYIVMAYTNMA